MKKIVSFSLLCVMLLCVAFSSALCEEVYFTATPDRALFNVWNNSSICLCLLKNRTAIAFVNGKYSWGSFDVYDGNVLYIDIDAPGAWSFDHKFIYNIEEDKLILAGANDILILNASNTDERFVVNVTSVVAEDGKDVWKADKTFAECANAFENGKPVVFSFTLYGHEFKVQVTSCECKGKLLYGSAISYHMDKVVNCVYVDYGFDTEFAIYTESKR